MCEWVTKTLERPSQLIDISVRHVAATRRLVADVVFWAVPPPNAPERLARGPAWTLVYDDRVLDTSWEAYQAQIKHRWMRARAPRLAAIACHDDGAGGGGGRLCSFAWEDPAAPPRVITSVAQHILRNADVAALNAAVCEWVNEHLENPSQLIDISVRLAADDDDDAGEAVAHVLHYTSPHNGRPRHALSVAQGQVRLRAFAHELTGEVRCSAHPRVVLWCLGREGSP